MSIIGISVLCLAIGFVTPLLALGDVHPFAPLWVRLTLIGFILLMYALYGLYRLWRALRMDEQLLRRFLHPRGEEVPVAGEIKADLRTVNHIVTQAIRQLRQLRVDMPGWRKIFEGKRFLYELPWFMVVGSPGDGKTTALLNTGLQFPLAEQMEQTSRILTVPGGGTLHCDWWFTNEAVLIDTAGRYARHDDGGEASAAQRNAGEWQGFLGLLRKHRPGAPLNGVILTLNVADLTAQSPAERLAACAALRARLAELRETLGIRFPVYLVVTKMDLLPGFSEYFRTLTSHLRAQIWGFTLPYSRRRKAGDPQALHAACAQELARLTLRLDQGLDTRLQEEYDLKSRQRLYTFPREFAALGEPLLEAIEQIFLDSKFDATQLNNTLRGVFFTSAAQAQADAVADQLSIWQRFVRAIKTARGESSASLPHALPDGNRSYFLHDLLTQFIFREAHLVEPNLQWAWRYRLLRLGGHLLVLVLAFLLWQGMQTSQQTNGDYLNEISARATRLDGDVKAYTGKPAMAPVPALLDSARELSAWPELDPDAPPLTWRYGLYSVPPVTDSVASLYNRLLDQLLLPPLVKRMEYVLADAIARQDSKAAYDALRIYLLLNLDKDHEDKYNAAEIQSWVINDLGNSDSVAGFGGRAAVLTHIEALFDGSRVVHSPYEKDEALIRQARAFLDGHTSTERIYARALAAMESEAPQEFTLVRAVGADAGTVFVRSNGAPLDRGVPGIFTREGYRELFDKRLPEFVAAATANDGWVMGRESTPKKLTDSLRSQIPGQEQSVAREVRRLYLTEYARRWQDFLDSIHSINSAGEEGSSGLAYDLQVLRTLASPDSPLVEWHQEGLKLDKEFIHTITANESLRTGQWVLDDFDFTKPRSLLANTVANPRETGHATYEHYEWPGDYFDKSEGEMLTRIRMEAQRSPGSRVLGGGNIRTLMTGYTFTLENYPTAEVNQEYLLMQTLLFVQDNAQHSGQDQHFTFSTRFELHPTCEVFRPQRTVSKPHTKGPQSAIVTGPSGQEIWTDQYGRVKVQFGWDRYGKMDENSSCWIRVSYPWAGKGFGMIQIPRIGQEVLVDFKNGDPDLPIIVGRTYNQDTMPPWGLPGMASQSGIFSHSLYGGPTNGNMLRFDDKTGAEEVKFHAEKDLNTTVKNNETHTVMVDRTKTIIKNETNSIGEDRNTTVTKNDGLSVKLAQTINIGTTYRLDVGDQFTLRCGNAALVLHKDGSIEFCGKQLMLHTSDVMQLIGKGIDMNPDGGTAVTADDIAPLPTSE
ncbi:type VI secretion system membrane subunit TssM [Salmonella enterica subsp. enterica serovar Muenchen]|nr:type VI secretion system membrane subunit TssM [Salmonella enterica]EDD3423223.1 type VI secretion system membrane subunit TssM [Salmonella enterica subsp. enterica serovar Muenchen]